MSTSHEVFVECDLNFRHDDKMGHHVAHIKNHNMEEYGRPPLIRYLRADLTCGECEHHNRRECPHKESVQQGTGIYVYQWPHTRVGCFAFVPKEA